MFKKTLFTRIAGVALVHSLFFSIMVFAESAVNPCSPLNSPNSVLKCALQNSANIQLQRSAVEVNTLAIEASAQRPNPEVELEGVKNPDSGITAGVKLLHTFELGGKRASRIGVAESEKRSSEIGVLKEQETVAVQTVVDLYRLRQIETELDTVKENLTTFGKISKQYGSAKRLNPEQEISLSVFKLALEENKLKEGSLLNEKRLTLTRLEQAVGTDLEVTKDVLPKLKTDWPELSRSDLAGADIQVLKSNVNLAQSSYEVEKSEAWPNLAIGPKIEMTTGETNETRFGVALTLPLPIYQANSSGKAKALADVKKNELSLNLNKQNLEREKSLLYAVYKKTSDTIKTTFTQSAIEAKHSTVHRLIHRGVISAPLVIELHRQTLDYYQTLHEQERQGIEALWRIYALEGRILKEELK